MEYRIGNVEERAEEAGKTFQIPSRTVRENLKPGDSVKLLFEFNMLPDGINGERMWIKITEASGGRYKGKLDSYPAFITDLKCGDEIEFGPENVASIWED